MKTGHKKSKKARRAAKFRAIKQNQRNEAVNWSRECKTHYGRRNHNLDILGFANYAEYLKSDLWASIRGTVLSGDPICTGCRRQASQVHHNDYDIPTLLGENLDSLRPICGRCHLVIEFSRKHHQKLPPWAAAHNLSVLADRTQRRWESDFDRSWENELES